MNDGDTSGNRRENGSVPVERDLQSKMNMADEEEEKKEEESEEEEVGDERI